MERVTTLLFELAMAFFLTYGISRVLIRYIPMMRSSIKPELESVQAQKTGTPSTGGLAFCLGTTAVTLLSPERFASSLLLPLLSLLLFGTIGLVDDLAKVHKANGDGIPSLLKLVLQGLASALLLVVLRRSGNLTTTLRLPFLGRQGFELGPFYLVLAWFYLMYFVNAVNITDGLDALAGGSSLPLLILLAFFSLSSGTPFSPALIGSMVAFLRFNNKPAQYFMGDCGSLALGGYIALSALMLKTEVALLVASGLFLVEFSSSLIQIIAIRSTGKKVFSIAPLHHAYELKGVEETKIVGSFTLYSWLFAMVGLLLFLVMR